MKQEPKHNSILHAFFAGSMVLVAMGIFSACVYGAVTGPLEVKPGTLAKFESDVEGDFAFFPATQGAFAKDSGGKAVFFASPKDGVYTLFFFGIRDGKPSIETFDFTVGNPEPTPSPDNNFSLTGAEKTLLVVAMKDVITGISRKTIITPQTARATFKNLVFQKTKSCQNGTCSIPPSINKALAEIEKSIDITTLEGIKSGFEQVVKELEK